MWLILLALRGIAQWFVYLTIEHNLQSQNVTQQTNKFIAHRNMKFKLITSFSIAS